MPIRKYQDLNFQVKILCIFPDKSLVFPNQMYNELENFFIWKKKK